jgi:nucleoside-diphosphate-sugar epimerase
MNILILGIDGFLGWPLALHMKARGHELMGIDNGSRRQLVREMGGDSAFDLPILKERASELGIPVHWATVGGGNQNTDRTGTITEYAINACRPDVIVNLAQQPSAPYSMRGCQESQQTLLSNVSSMLEVLWVMRDHAPDAHLVSLGTLGEYGNPSVDIPEGWFDLQFRGRVTRAQFPRSPGSVYHATKVMSSTLAEFACRCWKLTITDIMQGVVYGTRTPEMGDPPKPELRTRFDFDGCFGTAINRYCAQAVLGLAITPYGAGGQTRGFLPLADSIQCIRLLIENAPKAGEYRVVNQLEECWAVNDLALTVARIAKGMGIATNVESVTNPRIESEDHYYNPDHTTLLGLGYEPTGNLESVVAHMIEDLLPQRERMRAYAGAMAPTINWRQAG